MTKYFTLKEKLGNILFCFYINFWFALMGFFIIAAMVIILRSTIFSYFTLEEKPINYIQYIYAMYATWLPLLWLIGLVSQW